MGFLLACAYPDRIASRRGDYLNRAMPKGGSSYQLSNGRSASFTEVDSLQQHPWLVVAQSGGREGAPEERIFVAASLDPQLFDGPLVEQVTEQMMVDWDARADKLVAERQRCVGKLVLSRAPLEQIDAEQKQAALIGLVRKRGLNLLPWSDELHNLCARVELLRRAQVAGDWPDMSEAGLMASLDVWLAPFLDQVSHINHFAKLNLREILQAYLPWSLQQQLDQLAPERYQVPSGSQIRLDYTPCRDGQSPPVLAVKLQEMFGCEQTPSIGNGRIPLLIHLLSPARRPIQITQDLAGLARQLRGGEEGYEESVPQAPVAG